ncbi:uncharacterized protein LOC114579085, partial [Dendrobium catenatum]|uniref:uncharacterized protein LOC114579085 n=1 Tax=Dendrobium catenatum TaxID=906689 RepID=UPI00109FE737
MVGGGRRSPPRHPMGRGGGGRDGGGSEARTRSGVRGKAAVEGGSSGVAVNSRGGNGERRFSLSGLEGLVEIEADGKKLVHNRAPGKAGGTSSNRSDAFRNGIVRETTSSAGVEVETKVEGHVIEDRDFLMTGSSGLDAVMDILSGAEAEEFMKAVNDGIVSMDHTEQIGDDSRMGIQDGMPVESERDEMKVQGAQGDVQAVLMQDDRMMFCDKGMSASSEGVEVRNMVNNPVFESEKGLFTFGGFSSMKDFKKRSVGGQVHEVVKPRTESSNGGNVSEMKLKNLDARGDQVFPNGAESLEFTKRTSGVRRNVSSDNTGPEL